MHTFREHRSIAAQLRALGNESRIRIIHMLLREGKLCLRDIAAELHIRPKNASKHMHRLLAVGLVEGKRHGQRVEFMLTMKARQSKLLSLVMRNGLL